jgi:hypothetical protein
MTAATITWRGRAIPAVLPGVEYDEKEHRYTVFGERYPNVTGYLQPLRPGLEFMKNKAAMTWGTMLHRYAFHLVEGRLDMGRVVEEIRPTLEGFQKAVASLGVKDIHRALAEFIVYSKKRKFAGRLDFMFEAGEKDLLADFKTGCYGEAETRITALQLGGYAHALIEHGITKPTRMRIAEVNVQRDGTWKTREFNVLEAMDVFLAQVKVKNYFDKI